MFAVYEIMDVGSNGLEKVRQLNLHERFDNLDDALTSVKRLALKQEAYVIDLTTGEVVW